jgi:hypothetical protein
MKINTNSILILFGVIAFAIMACFPVTLMAMPLWQPGQPDTSNASATVQAIVTQTMAAITQSAPTAIPATATPVPPTATQTPLPTAVTYCDWVKFIKDVTIPDGTKLSTNEVFTKTWRLQNRGTCTWTPDYMLVYTSGSPMGLTTAVRLNGYVAPGQTIDVSVTLTAPASAGNYVGYWMLRNPSGTLFGAGNKANEAFFVDIKVRQDLPHGTVTGSLCYPSEFNPPLTLHFEKAGTGETISFSIPENQNVYSVLLPNGTYYAYAWAPVYNLEGAYNTQWAMKTFVVVGGQTTAEINLCDWSPYPHARGE